MKKPLLLIAALLGGASLVATFVACSAPAGGDKSGETSFALTRVELPKVTSVTYEMRQPELGGPAWRERIDVSPFGEGGRRFIVTKIDGDRDQRFDLVASNLGAIDPRTSAGAIWQRVDAFSTPDTVSEGAVWQPSRPRMFGTAPDSQAFVTDYERAYRIVKTWEVAGGHAFRAVFNVQAVIDETSAVARKHGLTNETWPLRDSVFGVGVADYFVTGGTDHHTYLLASAEYLFELAVPTKELAVSNLDELAARLDATPSALTVRCMVDAPSDILAVARGSRDPNTAFGLNICNGK